LVVGFVERPAKEYVGMIWKEDAAWLEILMYMLAKACREWRTQVSSSLLVAARMRTPGAGLGMQATVPELVCWT
jgi:hypothetical protein